MAATITIQIIGAESDSRDVRFSELITQFDAVKGALKETEISIRGERKFDPLDYRVIDLKHSSPSKIELEPITEHGNRDYANRVLKTFTTELRRIRAHSRLVARPEINRLIAYDEIGPREKSHVAEVRIALGERNVLRPKRREATVDKKFKQKLETILGSDEITYGAITGRLEYVNVHNARNFRLYPLLGPRWIRGRFTEDLLPEIRKGLDRQVTIFGKLQFKSWDKHPYALLAQKIDVHELDSELPTFNDLKGIAPDLTGGVRSSDWVRKIRDEEW
jgi:hypothetical protein